ncbi:MAG TPA: hypothetical protein VML55_11645 [Planctomycetaceae bacterium]|nr:hypothetical protein [Planctomycetaceae bacterium]
MSDPPVHRPSGRVPPPPPRRAAPPPRATAAPAPAAGTQPAVAPRHEQQRVRRQIAIGVAIAVLFLIAVWLIALWLRPDPAGGGGGGTVGTGTGQSSGASAAGAGDGRESGQSQVTASPSTGADAAGSEPAAASAADSPESAAGASPPASEPTPDPRPPEADTPLFQLAELQDEPPPAAAPSSSSAGGGSEPGEGEVQFFGAKDRARDVVYVVDCSGSMNGAALAEAKARLLASLQDLDGEQRFQIVFYNHLHQVMILRRDRRAALYPATPNNRRAAEQFIDSVPASGNTNHLPALLAGLAFQPDVVYLLTDGREPSLSAAELEQVRQAGAGRTRIHAIEFGEGAEFDTPDNFLKALAARNGGTYRYQNVAEFGSR